jgi:predicted nucleotidyltransferase
MNSKEEMSASSHFKEVLRKLNEHQVRYLIVGAYAVMKYTEPRYTKDLDIWVDPTPNNASRVFEALAEFGAPMNSVTVEDFANPELVFQIGIEPHRIDIMMGIKGLGFSDAWPRRVEAAFEDVAINLISKEDLLIAKQAAGRPQDLIDADVLRLSQNLKAKS